MRLLRNCTLVAVCLGLVLAIPAFAEIQLALVPSRPAPGELFRITVANAPESDGMWVTFDGREFPLWRVPGQGWEGLVAVDRDRTPGPARLGIGNRRDGVRLLLEEAPLTIVSREYPVQQLQVRDAMVNLSPADQERAAEENRTIRKALSQLTPDRLWEAPCTMPVGGPISSAFGVRRVYNGTPKSYHSGLDIAAPRGTEVEATASGTVALVGDFFYTGNTVFVDHGLGLYSAYFHLETVSVAPGQRVDAGESLGRVGSTGRSTGAHLHWGVYLCGRKADPLSLLRAYGAVGGGESP